MSTDEIYQNALLLIAKGNEKGYGEATRFLNHWLKGSGTSLSVSPELFENKKVKEAIEGTYYYFSSEYYGQRKNIKELLWSKRIQNRRNKKH